MIEVGVPWDRGWEEPAQWLIDRVGEKFTDAGRGKNGPDTPGYLTRHEDIEASPYGWDVCFLPDPEKYHFVFIIKDPQVAMLFKLTFAGQTERWTA